MRCPHCGQETPQNGVAKGGLAISGSGLLREADPDSDVVVNPNRARVRGKGKEYSASFELAWKEYVRKEEKFEAFGMWIVRAREVGGETRLLPLILASLKWQVPMFLQEGWKFAPYFSRYLKRRKWMDEPPPSKAVVAARDDRHLRAVDSQVARLDEARRKAPTPAEMAQVRGLVSQLAEAKAVKP